MELTNDDIWLLSQSTLFRTASHAALERLSSQCSVRYLSAGAQLYRPDDVSEELHAMTSGVMHVEVPTTAGAFFLPLSAPEVAGWLALVYPYRVLFSAEAVTDCRLIQLPAVSVRKLIDEDPSFGVNVLHQLSVMAVARAAALADLLKGRPPLTA